MCLKYMQLVTFRFFALAIAKDLRVGMHVEMLAYVDPLPLFQKTGGQVAAWKPQNFRRRRRRVQAWEVGEPALLLGE